MVMGSAPSCVIMDIVAVILAAGQGTRMRSRWPKVLHSVAGEPMIKHVVRAVSALEPQELAVVVGHEAQRVREALGPGYQYVTQSEQLGTGHAVSQCRPLLEGKGETVLVVYGDHPLLTPETLRRLIDGHERGGAVVTLLTFHPSDPTGYGRVVRDDRGEVREVVEEASATEEERCLIEVTSGALAFADRWLWPHLEALKKSEEGEYYLTDLAALAVTEGSLVLTFSPQDEEEAWGINSRLDLARAEAILRQRIRERLMLSGVTILDPPSTFIDSNVQIGPDTVIRPQTIIEEETVIGCDCLIGPNAWLRQARVGDGCTILASVVEEATLEEGVHVGPFSHLRPGSHLAPRVWVGNFVEVKASYVGPDTRIGHFSYIGDATLGARVNVGAGTITCNYDGVRKHRTIVEDGVFLGSDTMLVAPVVVGAGAKTGAGAVVTRDIPPGSLAYGVPARIRNTGLGEEVGPR